MISFSEFQRADKKQLIALWQACKLTRSWNDVDRDITFAMASPSSTILGGWKEHQIVAATMIGHDGHRGSLYYFAVHPEFRKRGIGSALMKAAEQWLKSQGVWKINLLIRDENMEAMGFYQSLGFAKNAVVSMVKSIG